MKKIVIIMLLFSCFLSFGQDLVVTGKVYSSSLNESGKIYYAKIGEKFNSKSFVKYDSKHNYVFKMSLQEIRAQKIQTIVFSIDTTSSTMDEYACVHRINVGNIAESQQFSESKSIKLKSDLLMDFSCEVGMVEDEVDREKDRFIGQYYLRSNDTIHIVSLSKYFNNYTASLPKQTVDFMNKEYGTWQYDIENKVLSFHISKYMNDFFGLILNTEFRYDFKVVNDAGSLQFKGENSTLTKVKSD